MSSYIKSPLNYIGGKYKILHHIIPSFPRPINNFVDLFTGGLNVGINVQANTIYANDQITYLVELYRFFQDKPTGLLLSEIRDRIALFDLSLTNIDGYNKLRAEFNRSRSLLDLFVLTCYSFNHQIRFNNNHDFNIPFGKDRSAFNDSIEHNLIQFCDALHSKNIILSSTDFRDFDFSFLSNHDVVYCDPPYLITTGSYNDGKRGFQDWKEKDDSDLLSLLDMLNNQGVHFALSNVFSHKGKTNSPLIQWSKKYNVLYIDNTYSNCSYHFKDRNTRTEEVLITNYKWEEPSWKQMTLF